MEEFETEKESLINLISWYRDSYHHRDFGHTEMIEDIISANNVDQLEKYYQVIEGWL